jgi:uncharacterized protein YlzI (FlbEa/FlbD family)
MKILTPIEQLNRDLADQLIEEVKQNPSAIAGQFVGIANGKIVVVSDDVNEIVRRLKQAEPDPSRTFVVEPRRDYTKVCEIWEIS